MLPFPELLATLRRWHVPLVLVAMLGFMYRFLFILWDELDRMKQARAARTSRPVGWRVAWKTSAMMLGQLLLRAWDRAERVHRAMLARGWDGSVKSLDGEWGSGI
ncbi:MAG TPA: CbiQ family ECF transporter T component [Planctomycetaceae bacterium]|nr:CbiQ family ECF transporter T component [Planctomycetaceae bacterium]